MLGKKRKFVAITTLIDKDIVITGETSYSGGIRIDGKVKGNLKVLGKEESLLIMGHESIVEGDIEVGNAIINGKVIGNIKCANYLELNRDAIVNGNIKYGIIEMHEGAIVNGQLKYKKIANIVAKKNFKDKMKKNFKDKMKNNFRKIMKKNIVIK